MSDNNEVTASEISPSRYDIIYEVRLGASVIADTTDPAELAMTRAKASQMIAAAFGDLTEELKQLKYFVYKKGYGRELEKRIQRLIALTEGENI